MGKELVDIINLEYDINIFNALLSSPHSFTSLFVKKLFADFYLYEKYKKCSFQRYLNSMFASLLFFDAIAYSTENIMFFAQIFLLN